MPDEKPDVKPTNELLKKFAERLGIEIKDDEEEEAILAKAKSLNDTIEPLRKAKSDGEANKTFREQFPDEWKKMQTLEAAQIESDARTFADNYSRFTVQDGDKEKKSNFGFSSLVLEKVADTHKKFADRSVGAADLKELLDLIGDKGIVDYSERGSARTGDGKTRSEDPKMAFSEVVLEVMKEDELSYEAAINAAAAKHPDLYEAYRLAIPQITTP